jgi:hypothetical protein
MFDSTLHSLLDSLVRRLTPSRVGVVVYPRVPGQFVGSAKSLCAAWKLARMRLLTRMGSNMSCLMLKTVKSLITQRALVWSREILPVLTSVLTTNHWGHH